MTDQTKNIWKSAYDIFKSIASGVSVFLLIGIFKYTKQSYDFQMETKGKVERLEQSSLKTAQTLDKRTEYEEKNDLRVSDLKDKTIFLFAHFGLSYNK